MSNTQSIPYGNRFTSVQDVSNTMQGLDSMSNRSPSIAAATTPPIAQLSTPSSEHQRQSQSADTKSPDKAVGNGSQKDAQAEDDAAAAAPTALAPSWTEMKTKAGKERKRLPLACIACRRKKIRCSGESPACKHCLRSRIPCVYKVTTRKAAPRTDYMAMLDKRLKRMEDRVIKIIPKEQQGILAVTGRATVKPSPPTLSRRASSTTATDNNAAAAATSSVAANKKRPAEQAIEDLETWSREGPTKQATRQLITPLRTHESDESSLFREGADRLPPREIQEHLAEVFFDFVYGQSYHLLHKPSFMRRLIQGEIAPVLCLAVCAVAARFSNHPALRSEPAFLRGEEWAAAAREIAIKRFDSPNITILIVYLILTLHEFGACQGSRSWMFAGMAQRMAYAMQLHHDPPHDPCFASKTMLSNTDREVRRRTLWACFMTDRFTSSGTERPTFMNADHLRLQLPISETYSQMELTGPTEDLSGSMMPSMSGSNDDQLPNSKDNMGVAAYMIKMVAIWGECINYFNMGGKAKEQHPMWDEKSRFMALRRAIRTWRQSLPDRLHYRPDNLASHVSEKIANQFIFMHIIYHQTALFVNRFALPLVAAKASSDTGIPTQFIQDSAKAAVNAANCISVLVRDGTNHNLVAPFAGYSAFFSSSVHIQGAFSNNEALVASSNKHLTMNVQYLTKMKRHWGVFHFMTENLRALYKKHVDAARSSTGEKVSDAIFQYGDWFDRYPHGVNGADYEGPQTEVKKEPGSDAGTGQQSDLQTVEDFFSSSSNLSPTAPVPAKVAKRKPSRKATQQAESLLTQQPVPDMYVDTTADLTSPTYPAEYNPTQGYTSQINQAYIDRQTALSAYADFDPGPAMTFAMPGQTFDAATMNLDFSNASTMQDMSGQTSYQAALSGGYFLPMNLDAAALAEASGPFSNGSFDWTTQFDMGNLQALASMPQGQMNVEGSANRNHLEPG